MGIHVSLHLLPLDVFPMAILRFDGIGVSSLDFGSARAGYCV